MREVSSASSASPDNQRTANAAVVPSSRPSDASHAERKNWNNTSYTVRSMGFAPGRLEAARRSIRAV